MRGLCCVSAPAPPPPLRGPPPPLRRGGSGHGRPQREYPPLRSGGGGPCEAWWRGRTATICDCPAGG
ncbi:hypothetical protein EJC49_09145 [Aquibium carbonis]|uniref:Uncharacterized protein n=1 Tax=Aquibium carbonis TaxID=2495581 RepID=A0A429YZ23_9HYPH|nr:hypothetical protein EJC49_09145 [Aquibium carbonis]